MVGAPSARVLTVVTYPYCDMIFLIDDVLIDMVPLIPQEVTRPDNLRQGVTDFHYLRFSGALDIDLLSSRFSIDAALSHHHHHSNQQKVRGYFTLKIPSQGL